MPRFPVHGLAAYRTLGYFQLPRRIAEQRDADYMKIISADTLEPIAEVSDRYAITAAVIGADELRSNWAGIFVDNWSAVYADSFFVVLKRP
jgi:hypothetical protein